MLMSAPSRAFSNDARNFVFPHGLNLTYQRLPDMANNRDNAWSVSGPVASPGPAVESWDYILGGTNNLQNFSNIFTPDFHSEGFDDVPSPTDEPTADDMRTASQNSFEIRRENLSTRSASDQCQDNLETKFNCVENTAPFDGGRSEQDVHTISLSDSEVQITDDFIYDKPLNVDGGSLKSHSSTADSPSCFIDGLHSTISPFKNGRVSPDIMYDAPLPARLESYDPTTASANTLAIQDGSEDEWLYDTAEGPSSLGAFGDDLPLQYDRRPRYAVNSWSSEPTFVPPWEIQQMPVDTVSPQALSMDNSSSALSSPTISSQQHSRSNVNARSTKTTFGTSCDASSRIHEVTIMLRTRTRHKVSEPITQGHPLILPKIEPVPGNENKMRPSPSKARTHAKHGPTTAETFQTLRRIKPKTMKPLDVAENSVEATKEPGKIAAALQRDARNEFLVGSRLMGVPYREIRRRGGFTEAESTLRGRFRTLTKERRERVRKPEWRERDIHLLEKAICKLADPDVRKGRIPWKKVSNFIFDHGGSYRFGNSTCRKKWDEIQAEREKEMSPDELT